MLKTQKLYYDYLREVKELVGTVGIENEALDHLWGAVADAKLLVPVIGTFSAGKSTLINSFLGNDCLPVDITPETTLATELYYSGSECLEAVRADGSTDWYQLSDFNELKEKAADYQYVRAYINSAQLKAIQPLVLVDMPGFGSPLEQHNKAILEYIGRGSHYVVLTSVEEGSLTRSMLLQISEVYDVNKGISFFLSKSNLRDAIAVEEIAEKIAAQLEECFDESHAVVPVGVAGGKDLARIIEQIDPEQLMEKIFRDQVLDAYRSCKEEIHMRIATLGKSKGENEATLEEIRKGISDIIRKKEEMLAEAREKYTDVRVERIVDKVGRALSDAADQLVDTALSCGADALRQSISDLARHTLLREVRSSMNEINAGIVSDISLELKGLDGVLAGYSSEADSWLEGAVKSTETLLHSGIAKLGELNHSFAGKGGAIYKMATTILSVTTSVVAPVVELIIIFLPELLSAFMKKSREQSHRQEVRTSIMTRTIPEVKSRLRSQLPEIFCQQVKLLIEEISAQFESRIEKQRQIITSQQAAIEARTAEIEDQVNGYASVVEQLNLRTNAVVTL